MIVHGEVPDRAADDDVVVTKQEAGQQRYEGGNEQNICEHSRRVVRAAAHLRFAIRNHRLKKERRGVAFYRLAFYRLDSALFAS